MRTFLKLTVQFLFIALIINIIQIEFCERIVSQNAKFDLPVNTRYIVLGHSHPQCAFNDSLIDNFKNLSASAESYFYTLMKLREVIDQNPSVETVFIEFTNNQINKPRNTWIWGEEFITNRYPLYSPFMEASDKWLLLKNNFRGYISSTALSSKENLRRILNNDYDYSDDIGNYLHLDRNKTDSLLKNISPKDSADIDRGISESNLLYLSRIIDYGVSRGKRVILIRSPQHNLYPGYSNEDEYQKIRNAKFSSVEYIDLSRFPLKNSEFGDLDHLNYKGARLFSAWFSSMLRTGLLDKKDMQAYIDEEIKAIRAQRFASVELPG